MIRYSEAQYNAVLNLVKSGLTIEQACKNLELSRSYLYKSISGVQKKELISNKVLNAKYRCPKLKGAWADPNADKFLRSFDEGEEIE